MSNVQEGWGLWLVGIFHRGLWLVKIFHKSLWLVGIFHRGSWLVGIFHRSSWLVGILHDDRGELGIFPSPKASENMKKFSPHCSSYFFIIPSYLNSGPSSGEGGEQYANADWIPGIVPGTFREGGSPAKKRRAPPKLNSEPKACFSLIFCSFNVRLLLWQI